MTIRNLIGKIVRALTTGLLAMGLTVVSWTLIVMLLDRRIGGEGHLLWASSLWFSAMACTGLTACLRFNVNPVLGCTFVFGIFALGYFVCEGPRFGVVSEGGDPAATTLVFWNVVFLPLGVFVASDVGSRLGAIRKGKIQSWGRPDDKYGCRNRDMLGNEKLRAIWWRQAIGFVRPAAAGTGAYPRTSSAGRES